MTESSPTAESRPSRADRRLPPTLRLLVDDPMDGPANMAVDEAMLAAVGAGAAAATLRLYRWRPATLSLGYFQAFADIADQSPQVQTLAVVRRTTGGGAIIHADELTYSLVLPDGDGETGTAAELYTMMHAAIAAAASALAGGAYAVSPAESAGESSAGGRGGPFMCFARRSRFDLLAGADKLAGSAQRRTKQAVLQHGSIILARTYPDQPCAAMSEIAGREVTFDQAADALVAAVAAGGTKLIPARLTDIERRALDDLRAKHLSEDWLKRR